MILGVSGLQVREGCRASSYEVAFLENGFSCLTRSIIVS